MATQKFCSLDLNIGVWDFNVPQGYNITEAPTNPNPSKLSEILQSDVDPKYFLSEKACRGILRRAHDRGKKLPEALKIALENQANGFNIPVNGGTYRKQAHPRNANEGQGWEETDTSDTLNVFDNGEARTPNLIVDPVPFAQNEREEVRDLGDKSGSLSASGGSHQQTYVATVEPGIASRDGGHYYEDVSGTLRAEPGDNQMSVVLNDQGGQSINVEDDLSPTLRAEDHGHAPCVMEESYGVTAKGNGDAFISKERHSTLSAGGGMPGQSYPCVMAIENHANDSRFKFSKDNKVQTLSSRMGTGGNNEPMVLQKTYGIDQQGGKGNANYTEDVSPTLMSDSHGTPHAVAYPDEKVAITATTGKFGGASEEVAQCLKARDYKDPQIVVKVDKKEYLKELMKSQEDGQIIMPEVVAAIEGNGTRPSHKGNGYSEEDVSYTLNATEQHAVAYGIGAKNSEGMKSENPESGIYKADTSRTLDTSGGNPACNQGGIGVVEERDIAYGIDRAAFNQGKNAKYSFAVEEEVEPTIVSRGPGAVAEPSPKTIQSYFIRRLTPLECARLQGFPDSWLDNLALEPTEEDIDRWEKYFETHRKVITGGKKPKTRKQIEKWLKEPYKDSSAYKIWGNGISLPCAVFVLGGVGRE